MRFIQLDGDPKDGISKEDAYQFGKVIRNNASELLTRFNNKYPGTSYQNYGVGWYCSHTPIQFSIELIMEEL